MRTRTYRITVQVTSRPAPELSLSDSEPVRLYVQESFRSLHSYLQSPYLFQQDNLIRLSQPVLPEL